MNQRLTEKGYWDGVHVAEDRVWSRAQPAPVPEAARPCAGARVKARVKKLLGPRLIESMCGYDDYLLWDVILPRHLAGRRGEKVVEIGSAPGEFLTRLHERFGLVPYGIEYSPPGAELNRRLFAAHGIAPDNVIEADFFDAGVHERYRESFDVVLSRGFIEHFADVDDVIRKHLSLLRPGGLLVVNIPNLKGANLALSWLFHREVVAMHNLRIMAPGPFAALFPDEQVQSLFCGYYGTFSFYLFNARAGSIMRLPLTACMRVQPLLNALFRRLLQDQGVESSWFSPNLLFVGVKR